MIQTHTAYDTDIFLSITQAHSLIQAHRAYDTDTYNDTDTFR